MSWYHRIATFLNDALPQVRATRRTNLALLTVAILERRALAISVLVRAWRVELPYSHHQRKKRLFRFLSNTGFDTVAVQTALLGLICQAARLRGLTPIMIDWSDLGQGRNGLFAAVCFRGRGLPLLSWVSTPAELDPSQNRVEEFFIGRLLRHLPTNIRPLLLADRGFGRASLIRFLQQMPRHTGYPADYVIRLKGDVVVQSADYRGRLRDYRLPKGRILFWPQTLYRSDGAVVINLVLYRPAAIESPGIWPPHWPTLVKRCGCIGNGCSRSSTSRTVNNASGSTGAPLPRPTGCSGCWSCCWWPVPC